MFSSISSLLLLAAAAQASVLNLQSPRFTVFDSTATQLRSESISTSQKIATPVVLGPKDILKLTFQVTEEGGQGVQPHQTFLRFYDELSGEEGIQPVRVTPGGKAKFELNMARPPLSLPPTTTNPLKVTLLVGSFVHSPLKVDLFDLVLPASHFPAPHPDEASFHPLPEIHHTFRPDQKLPNREVSAVFTLLVVSPWVALLSLWAQVSPRTPHLFSPTTLSFAGCLGAFEVLLCWYWVDLKLGQVLLYGAILSVPTVLTGKQALASMGNRREGRK